MFTILSICHRYQLDREQAESFAGAQKIIDDRIQLEYEREQQEQLLLSVIPAYIAAEVKRRIMNKMNDNSGNFAGGNTSSVGSFNETGSRTSASTGLGQNYNHYNDGQKQQQQSKVSLLNGRSLTTTAIQFKGNNDTSGRGRGLQHVDLLPKQHPKQRFHELYVQRHNNVR